MKETSQNSKKITKSAIEVSSAFELPKSTLDSIKERFGNDNQMKVKIDPTLIGGVRIKKSNELFDGTVIHQLDLLRDKLYNLKSYDKYN
jgi:F0F1-type ATP synthase delta subunit